MAETILAPATQYSLSDADRKAILATIPSRIQYPGGIIPDAIVKQSCQYFPKLRGRTGISQTEMENIMESEVRHQQSIFLTKNATIFG